MKKNILFFLLLCVITAGTALANDEIDELVKKGITAHDRGDYQTAVEYYEKALEIDPNSSLALYEITYSLYAAGEHDRALEYAEKALENSHGQIRLPVYVTYASLLDDMGKVEEACEIFEEAIKDFPEHYLLRYNYGLTLLRIGELDRAMIMFEKAIELNPFHPTSHLSIASIHSEAGDKVETILPCYFFLLLEPNSARSLTGLQLLESTLKRGYSVEKGKDGERTKVNIYYDADSTKPQKIRSIELLFTMVSASAVGESDTLDEFSRFLETNTKFLDLVISMTDELKNDDDNKYLWHKYMLLLKKINNAGYKEPFLYYITRSKANPKATKWMSENQNKMKEFENWLKEEIFSDPKLFILED
jgi:tetratricopeptide (TPR) repeat protein